MRVVLQRVRSARVDVDAQLVGEIGPGLLLLTGITHSDTPRHTEWMARKLAGLRIFASIDGPSGFDRSILEVSGGVLVVSQFTLYGEARKGRRPDFMQAARPEIAAPLIETFVNQLRAAGIVGVAQGRFGADMQVSLINDGPVTLVIDTPDALP